jgi:TRAP-type mannitol/chloroaromatic compound transport system substrate-binding protein
MRAAVIGIVIGLVVGVVIGATVIAPRLASAPTLGPTKVAVKSMQKLKAFTAQKQTRRWRLASAYNSNLPQLGSMAKQLETGIWRVSDGAFEIKFHEPNALVPTEELFQAVSAGAIDAAFATPEMWVKKIIALGLFSSIPFGPKPIEYIAWIYSGGGQEIYNGILHKAGLHGVFCGLISNASSGWFRKQVRTIADLKGLKIRSSGLGSKVLEKLGVEIKSVAQRDIFGAFETGELDGAEISLPSIDVKLGIHKLLKHYYYPGWNRPSMLFDVIINLKKWEALRITEKNQIEAVCAKNINIGLSQGEAAQFSALKKIKSNNVKIHSWPTEITDALKTEWQQHVSEVSNANNNFRRAWVSLSNFRRNYSIWSEFSR